MGPGSRSLSQGLARANLFSELNLAELRTAKQSTSMVEIDELLSKTPQLDNEPATQRYLDFLLGDEVKDPRDVAKSINISGPASGRSVDVKFLNVGFAVGSVALIIRTNNIKQQWHFQKRYIRPAKYRKEKKRQWWRQHFARGFSDLMADITDAKRRGY